MVPSMVKDDGKVLVMRQWTGAPLATSAASSSAGEQATAKRHAAKRLVESVSGLNIIFGPSPGFKAVAIGWRIGLPGRLGSLFLQAWSTSAYPLASAAFTGGGVVNSGRNMTNAAIWGRMVVWVLKGAGPEHERK